MHYANLHHIQRKILNSLAIDSPQRFSTLQPAVLSSNIFSYHLNKLLQSGYIEKNDRGYFLTRKGLKLIHFYDGEPIRKGPPKLLTMLFIQDLNRNTLLIERDNSPFKGWHGVPSGLIHYGENLHEAAQRELYEKTSIKLDQCIDKLAIRGVLDFRYIDSQTKDIFVHAMAFVFSCVTRVDISAEKIYSKYGKLHWSSLQEKEILPEVHIIYELIKRNNFTIESVILPEPSTTITVEDLSNKLQFEKSIVTV